MQLRKLDPDQRTYLWRWGLIGVTIRALFMPFATHGDLLAEYDRASRVFQTFSLDKLGPSRVLDILHGVYFWLMSFFAPRAGDMFAAVRFDIYSSEAEATAKWLRLVNYPEMYRALFLFKLPYLAMDIAAALILFKLFNSWNAGRRAYLFWVLNPVIIFSTYIFGRYEVLVALLFLLALQQARKGRAYVSMLLVGGAALARVSPVILLPVFALTLAEKTSKRVMLLTAGLAPLVVAMLLASPAREGAISVMPRASLHTSYPLMMSMTLYLIDRLYIFPLLYFAVLIVLYTFTRPGYESLVKGSTITMLFFFATSFFHPHYLSWLMPFTALFVFDEDFFRIQVAQIAAWIVYIFQFGSALAGYLFAPMAPAFFWGLPSPFDIISRFTAGDVVIGLSRSFFSAAAAIMVYLAWKERDVNSA